VGRDSKTNRREYRSVLAILGFCIRPTCTLRNARLYRYRIGIIVACHVIACGAHSAGRSWRCTGVVCREKYTVRCGMRVREHVYALCIMDTIAYSNGASACIEATNVCARGVAILPALQIAAKKRQKRTWRGAEGKDVSEPMRRCVGSWIALIRKSDNRPRLERGNGRSLREVSRTLVFHDR
jgi:hypothetical protein